MFCRLVCPSIYIYIYIYIQKSFYMILCCRRDRERLCESDGNKILRLTSDRYGSMSFAVWCGVVTPGRRLPLGVIDGQKNKQTEREKERERDHQSRKHPFHQLIVSSLASKTTLVRKSRGWSDVNPLLLFKGCEASVCL